MLELKDKVGVTLDTGPAAGPKAPAAAGPDPFLQARVALQNLGLPLRDAEAALQGAPDDALARRARALRPHQQGDRP